MRDLLPLRDRLAIDRTDLANRRTWLATARTALALFVSGASFLQFFEASWMRWLGWLFMALSLPVLLMGWRSYRRRHQNLLEDARRAAEAPE